MFPEDGEQLLAVGLDRRRRAADAFPLGFRHRVPALLADRPAELALDVQRQHRDAVDARELEQRQVELGRHVPVALPFRLVEELGHRQLARHPAVEHRLHAAREHLEADHHVRPPRVQRGQRLQLPAVVVHLVVYLTEQHHVALRHVVEQGRRRGDARPLAAGQGPDRRLGTGLGVGSPGEKCSGKGE